MALLDVLSTDEHLRLVIDVLDEDDAFCAALCCTAMRDAVFSRFPAGVRTRFGAACASSARACWAMRLGDEHAPAAAELCAAAACLNRPAILRKLGDLGAIPDSRALCMAARNRSVLSAEWLLLHCMLMPGPLAVEAAAEGAHSRILERFLTLARGDWSASAYVAAARGGSVDCLRLLVSADDDDDDDMLPDEQLEAVLIEAEMHALRARALAECAKREPAPAPPAATPPEARGGLISSGLAWLRPSRSVEPAPARGRLWPGGRRSASPTLPAPRQELPAEPADIPLPAPLGWRRHTAELTPQRPTGRRWDERACEAAAAAGHWDALKFLLVAGAPCDWTSVRAAACRGDVTMANWIAQQGCAWLPGADEIAAAAARCGHVKVLRWMRQRGWEWHDCASPALVVDEALRAGQHELLGWLVDKGFPVDHGALEAAAA